MCGNVVNSIHTAPFKDCIIPKNIPCPFDAYEGSARIGEFINSTLKGRNVSVICGHRHKKLSLEIGNVKLCRSPVGYLDKSQTDYEKIAKEVIGEFDI